VLQSPDAAASQKRRLLSREVDLTVAQFCVKEAQISTLFTHKAVVFPCSFMDEEEKGIMRAKARREI
jgi:hypothetical protein